MTTVAVSTVRSRIPRVEITRTRLVIALIVLAVVLRLIGLGSRPIWLDEAYSVYAIRQSWHDLWSIVPTYETHPPFYYSILKVWGSLFGSGALSVRGLSAVFSILTVPIAMAAALELERQDPTGRPLLRAGICGFLAASAPILVFLDQQARPYALMVLTYAIATWGLLRLMREFRSGAPGSVLSWSVLAGGTELTLWSHSLGILYAACLALALFPAWVAGPFHHARFTRGLIAAAIALLLYVPCLLIISAQVGDWSGGWLRWKAAKIFELTGLYPIPFEAMTVASAVAFVTMLLLIKRAVQHAATQSGWTSDRALLVLWWGPPLLAILISSLVMPVFLLRTLAPTLVPGFLAMGGVVARAQPPRERLIFTAALALTLMPTAIQTATQPASEQWDDVAAYLQRVVVPGDQVWIYPNDSVLPLSVAASRPNYSIRELPADFPAVDFKGVVRSGSPGTPSLTSEQAQWVAQDPALNRVGTIWLLTRQIEIFDPNADFERALMQRRRAGKVQKWGYIEVRPYYAK